jgi:hypothetical protein
MIEVFALTMMMLKGLNQNLDHTNAQQQLVEMSPIVKIMPNNEYYRAFQKKYPTVKLFSQAIGLRLFFSLFSPNICSALRQSCMDNLPLWIPSYNTTFYRRINQ